MNTKLSKILAEISAGELLDKITILEIKKEKIKNKEKLIDIDKELKSLNNTLNENIPDKSKVLDLIYNLKKINLKLWDIEENKRLAEKNKNSMKILSNFLETYIKQMMRERKLN